MSFVHRMVNRERRKRQIIESKLARCHRLAERFALDPIAQHLRELAAELETELQLLNEPSKPAGADHRFDLAGFDQREARSIQDDLARLNRRGARKH
jgi:hypothetical protein